MLLLFACSLLLLPATTTAPQDAPHYTRPLRHHPNIWTSPPRVRVQPGLSFPGTYSRLCRGARQQLPRQVPEMTAAFKDRHPGMVLSNCFLMLLLPLQIMLVFAVLMESMKLLLDFTGDRPDVAGKCLVFCPKWCCCKCVHKASQAKEGVAAKKPSAQPPHPFCTLLLAAEAATNTDTARKAGVTMPHHARSWGIAKRQGWCKRPPVGGKQPLEETRKETPQSVCKGPKHWRKRLMEEGSRELKVDVKLQLSTTHLPAAAKGTSSISITARTLPRPGGHPDGRAGPHCWIKACLTGFPERNRQRDTTNTPSATTYVYKAMQRSSFVYIFHNGISL
ncbi:hypothetical protein Anapl_05288 [Anas platyrhynchos]|uniref:Uncharacterized protein n=1 Tax=Anas platyrhynchos TaxID=8839 RepID=R0LD20_ANAPL|nr:hypothetical protein Anapl_05288 [Anas platyrhynchos]